MDFNSILIPWQLQSHQTCFQLQVCQSYRLTSTSLDWHNWVCDLQIIGIPRGTWHTRVTVSFIITSSDQSVPSLWGYRVSKCITTIVLFFIWFVSVYLCLSDSRCACNHDHYPSWTGPKKNRTVVCHFVCRVKSTSLARVSP